MIRNKENLLLKEVAFKCGISMQCLSRYENDQRTPDNNFLKEFVKHFHVSLEWLLFGESPIYKENQKKETDIKESFLEFFDLINTKELPVFPNAEISEFTFEKITDDNPDNYLLLLKYMQQYTGIRKSIFQFFQLVLKPRTDKNPGFWS
jgi:transcriptional regulator with XRE-family HTH domain